MRVLKFRAWVKKEKAMYPNLSDLGFWIQNGHEVMQYTGLQDKNGIDIYEGDIVKSWNLCGDEKGKPVKAVVEWERHFWKVRGITNNNQTGLAATDDKKFGVEIIGNIYKNPELLKEG